MRERQGAGSASPSVSPSSQTLTDWGEAPDVSRVYGRESELAMLEEWILNDGCRLVAVLGMGGVGKSALVTMLAMQMSPHPPNPPGDIGHFSHVIWCRNAPLFPNFYQSAFRCYRMSKSSCPREWTSKSAHQAVTYKALSNHLRQL